MFKYDDETAKRPETAFRRRRRCCDSRPLLGLLLVVIGGLFLARNYGLLDDELSHKLFSWQMLLVAIGGYKLIQRSYTSGIVFIAVGLFFLVQVPEMIRENFWPIIIVALGLILIFNRSQRRLYPFDGPSGKEEGKSFDHIDELSIFGGRKISVVSDHFQGGRVTSIFGGSKINLLYAKPAEGCVIDVLALFGGTQLIVPDGWNVRIEVVSIFGGFDDKRSQSVIAQSTTDKVVIIRGTCIFGGGELKSWI